MRLLHKIRAFIRSLFWRKHLDAELNEELRYHLERQTSENLQAGMTPAEARRSALVDLGGMQQITEKCRETRRTQWLETFVQDIRFGVRAFLRRPGFSLSVLTIMAFGIGSATAVFSIVNRVLLSPLPYREPANLVRIYGVWEHGSREGISPPDFADFRRQSQSFASLAGATIATPLLNLRGAGDPEQVRSRQITSGFFSTLGIQPMFGREFRSDDEVWKGPPVAILSYGLWQRQYGGDATVVGRTLQINGVSYTVVGILPPFFNFLGATDIFTPLQFNPAPGMRSARILIVIGRTKTDLRSSQAELETLGRRLQTDQAQFDRGWSATATPLTDEVVKDVRAGLTMLLGAIGLGILLVSASIATLMLSYSASRETEISVRLALGASRARLIRQLLTESLLLTVTGGVLGWIFGFVGLEFAKHFGPQNIPRLTEASLDLRVLALGFVLSAAIGIVCALEPAYRTAHMEIGAELKSGNRTATTRQFRLRDALVVTEVAVSTVLLIGAGLLLRSLIHLQNVNPGFQASNLVTTRVALPSSKYGDGGIGAKVTNFWHEALDRIDAIPGVEGAALTSELPLGGLNNPSPRTVTTPGGVPRHVYLRSVSPGYWNVMRIPLLSGRLLNGGDRRTTQRVVVINQQFKKDVFGESDPIGQQLTFDFQQGLETENYQAIVVGVTGDVHHTSLATPPFREAYLPLDQAPLFNCDLVVRTANNSKTVEESLKRAIWSLDRDESLGAFETMNDALDTNLALPRFRTYVLAGFAAMALFLSAGGLYGLLSFLVSQQERAIGIRLALGALPTHILGLVAGRGVGLTAVGLLLGLSLSFAAVRFVSTLIFGISVVDPVTFIAVASILLLVSLLAGYLPSRRAMKLNPVDVLRSE